MDFDKMSVESYTNRKLKSQFSIAMKIRHQVDMILSMWIHLTCIFSRDGHEAKK